MNASIALVDNWISRDHAGGTSAAKTDYRGSDLFVGTTAIVFGLAVAAVAITRWSFFARSNRAQALARFYGEAVARWIYVGLGTVLVGLGIWVLLG